MFVELIMIQCSKADCTHTLKGSASILVADVFDRLTDGTLLFSNHSAAIRAGEAAGWFLSSENIGGDICPACIENMQAPEVWGPSILTKLCANQLRQGKAIKAMASFVGDFGPPNFEPSPYDDLLLAAGFKPPAVIDGLFPSGPWGLSEEE
jgi:hypothetical protein